ncbi:hypothetical protein J4433_02700 [Candidatus Pacearchaeota archaeon]|nr:hypothetical protein [Candidatus Pacearchaeota archaeon]
MAEDNFYKIARSNTVSTPRGGMSDDMTCEFYDPTTGTKSVEKQSDAEKKKTDDLTNKLNKDVEKNRASSEMRQGYFLK